MSATKVTAATAAGTPANTRIVQMGQNPFREIDYDQVANLIIITRELHAGDAITEVNGKPVTTVKDLPNLQGGVTLKVMPTPLHQGPSVSSIP
ncbi:unnamed protein product [Gongylonema pulchrum]|uniref:PDZ domain-containing protein n=1 Tax=Gongylonema pulchrum TaxID=637853 RepID=A0A183EUN4_9BILA|nr:unnamed protein product [Gongylonema pulchrum]